MARTRSIKPGFLDNELLAECQPLARILFEGLWLHADRDGRLEDRPKRLKSNILPYDDVDADALLNELDMRNFIIRYQVDGQRYIQVTKFTVHQKPHRNELSHGFPPYSDQNPNCSRLNPSVSDVFVDGGLLIVDGGLIESAPPKGGCPPRTEEPAKIAVDAELLAWIAWWNRLRAESLVPCGAGDDPPSEAVTKSWNRVRKSAALRAMLSDRAKLESEIRLAPILREGWFRLEKLFGGKNRDGEYIITKLVEGAYRGGANDRNGTSATRQGPGQKHDPGARAKDPRTGTF